MTESSQEYPNMKGTAGQPRTRTIIVTLFNKIAQAHDFFHMTVSLTIWVAHYMGVSRGVDYHTPTCQWRFEMTSGIFG